MKKLTLFFIALIFAGGCSTENKRAGTGAAIGAAAGAVVGGIIGHQSGQRDKGAVIGAMLGGGIGAAAGHRMDQQAKELEKIAETKRTEQGLVAKLKSDILFDTGKSELKPAAKANLAQMAEIMKKYPENILTIKGFTDNTGSVATNQTLSQRRAEAVRKHLAASGLTGNDMAAKGLGPNEPIADNKTADGRSKNRRVEIEVTVDQSKVPQS